MKASVLMMARLAELLASYSYSPNTNNNSSSDPLSDLELRLLQQKKEKFMSKNRQKNGLKPFTRDGVTVWARDERNGNRKLDNFFNSQK